MKVTKYMIIATILIILGLFIYFKFVRVNPNTTFESTKINIGANTYSLEIAKNTSQLSLGLSNRQNLCPKCGMIFVFPFEGVLPFWMKDTLLPLDMIWLNSQNQIVSIQTASVETSTSDFKLKIYKNDQAAKFVIELNAGTAKQINLKVGDTINLPNL